MYNTILFDLDGTLTDPGLGITNSVLYALEQLGYPLPPRESLYKFIGPPLLDSFQAYYGMTPEQAEEAVRLFRVYFAETGIMENSLYPGIPEVLDTLQKAGRRLILATSKPQGFAERILEHFDLRKYFDQVVGATMDAERSQKHQVIAYAIETYGVTAAEAVMVGDRKHDVLGAKKNGMACIGVLFGYGDAPELNEAGAIALAADPQELLRLLEQN